ncbi:hypothetical protein K504DRAFT_354904, partial [Pleomassaria siparia CBS 279.74]
PQFNVTRTENKTTAADRLARKRVLDRKAQQAARERTKWTIGNLQHQVAQLNNALIGETSRLQSLLDQSKDETEQIRAENAILKMEIETHSLEILNANGAPGTRSMSIYPSNLEPYEQIPWNTGPTCLSDRIIQGYVATARMRVHATSDIFLEEQPDMSTLLARGRSNESPGVSNVVSDIVLAYQEINTLPKKAACLYLILLSKWFIFRTKSTFDQIPIWLRPIPLQLQIEHPAWIDRIPWPNARHYLINNPSITFDDFASCYSSSFDVSWPYEQSHVFISFPSGASISPSSMILNPVFEQQTRQLKNWSVSDVFWRQFPDLAAIIETDS